MNHLDVKASDDRIDAAIDFIDIDKQLSYGKGNSALQLGSGTNGVHLQWRGIEDELPKRNVVVLVCFKSSYDASLIRAMAYRTFNPGKGCWSTDLVYEEPDGYTADAIEVTHWMPLPDLPV
ncbi:MAG: DUF551 domain-containing protein [Desulfobacteraceae bacterium]|nr:DUF551 domain-containing protein [Desulfobacteraceae bacterium]